MTTFRDFRDIESLDLIFSRLERQFYENNTFFSLSGNILLSINPYPSLELVSVPTRNEKDWSSFTTFVDILKQDMKSTVLFFRGCSGGGKTDIMKGILLYLLLYENDDFDDRQRLVMLRDIYPFLKGSYNIPFKFPTTTIKSINLSITYFLHIFSTFGNVSTDQNINASKHVKHLRLNYSETGRLVSLNASIYLLESMGFITRSVAAKTVSHSAPYIFYLFLAGLGNSIKDPDDFKINSNQKETFLSAASLIFGKDFDLIRDYHYIQGSILNSGMITPDEWRAALSVVAACIHLLTVTIVGAEITIISAATKSNLIAAENLLGLPLGSISTQLLKKRIDNSKIDGPTTDCKPVESRALLESLTLVIYKRTVEYLISKTQVDTGRDTAYTLHLVDIPGYNSLLYDEKSTEIEVINCYFSQLIASYVEEHLHFQFIKKVFTDELQLFMEEDIDLGEANISYPDLTPYCDIFHRPSTGIIPLLEEICMLPKVEDKLLADKIQQNNHKQGNSGAKSPSHKGKSTLFIISHYFGDIHYDCEGFIIANKSYNLPIQLVKALDSSCISFIRQPTPNIYSSPSTEEDVSMQSMTSKKRNPIASSYLFNEAKRSLQSLVDQVVNLPKSKYICCLRVNPYLRSSNNSMGQRDAVTKAAMSLSVQLGIIGDVTEFNMAYFKKQLEYFHVSELLTLNAKGYAHKKSFVDFYIHFRVVLPFSLPNFPISLPTNMNNNNSRKLCMLMFNELKKMIGPIDDHDFLCGKTKVFMRDQLSNTLDQMRTQLIAQIRRSCLKIQSIFRMLQDYFPFKIFKASVIIVQKYFRRKKFRDLFLKLKRSAQRVQSSFRMHWLRSSYRRMLSAVTVIKKYCFHLKKDKLRYHQLQKSVRLFQNTVRCFIIRKKGIDVYKSLALIQRSIKRYIDYKHEKSGKSGASLIIQKWLRRYLVQRRNKILLRLLLLKKEQRLAYKVVLKIQSRWRRMLVVLRINELKTSSAVIQRWFRATKVRFHFLFIRKQVVFIQSVIRRKLSCRILIEKQIENLFRNEHDELNSLLKVEIETINKISFPLRLTGSGYIPSSYNCQIKLTRVLISYNIYFDVNFAYPDGWMVVVMKWIISQKEKEKKNVQKIALGNNLTY